MGSWGYAPWGNDAAADWFGGLFKDYPLAARVEEALKMDPEEDAECIRAAAALLIMLGRTYVWPVDEIDRQLYLAISQMEKVLAFQEGPFAAAVAEEIALLKSRRSNAKGRPVLPQPASWGSFWS